MAKLAKSDRYDVKIEIRTFKNICLNKKYKFPFNRRKITRNYNFTIILR